MSSLARLACFSSIRPTNSQISVKTFRSSQHLNPLQAAAPSYHGVFLSDKGQPQEKGTTSDQLRHRYLCNTFTTMLLVLLPVPFFLYGGYVLYLHNKALDSWLYNDKDAHWKRINNYGNKVGSDRKDSVKN